jgi:precorrin-3B C17-methyltransferase
MGLVKIAVTPGFEVGGSLFTSEQLAQIGLIAGENAKIELTTFKQLYVELQEERAVEVTEKLIEVGLEIYPAGFVTKSLITCNFCRGAEDAGLEIAERLNQAIAGIETPSPLKIGYAGCALGTSEPLLKDIGIVKMKDSFDVYIGGEPKSIKPAFAMMFASGVPADNLIPVVLGLIDYFKNHGKKKEKFSKFTQRIAMETLRDACNL